MAKKKAKKTIKKVKKPLPKVAPKPLLKQIRIECEGAAIVPLAELLEFQGDLKEIDEATIITFSNQIERNGFSEPLACWKSKGKTWILDGHQRLTAVKYMIEKMGYEPPAGLPVSYSEAKNKSEAKDMLLGNVSQYGNIDDDGLGEFLHGSNISLDELQADYKFSGFNIGKFVEGWKPEVEGTELDMPEQDSQKSKIKSIQMFFDIPTALEMSQMLDKLKERYGLDSITSAILHAVNTAASK